MSEPTVSDAIALELIGAGFADADDRWRDDPAGCISALRADRDSLRSALSKSEGLLKEAERERDEARRARDEARSLALQACDLAHDRTTIIGDGQYGRINEIRAEIKASTPKALKPIDDPYFRGYADGKRTAQWSDAERDSAITERDSLREENARLMALTGQGMEDMERMRADGARVSQVLHGVRAYAHRTIDEAAVQEAKYGPAGAHDFLVKSKMAHNLLLMTAIDAATTKPEAGK